MVAFLIRSEETALMSVRLINIPTTATWFDKQQIFLIRIMIKARKKTGTILIMFCFECTSLEKRVLFVFAYYIRQEEIWSLASHFLRLMRLKCRSVVKGV